MIQFVYQILRTYAPIITLPVAVVIGTIGYAVENAIHRENTPNIDSVEEKRRRRQVERGTVFMSSDFIDPSTIVPKTILNTNLPPSLTTKTDK